MNLSFYPRFWSNTVDTSFLTLSQSYPCLGEIWKVQYPYFPPVHVLSFNFVVSCYLSLQDEQSLATGTSIGGQ